MKLDIAAIANRLGMPVSTVDRWIRQGRIPVERRGPAAVIEESVLVRWAASRQLPLDTTAKAPSPSGIIGLHDAMTRGGIWHDVPGDTAEAVLTAAVERLADLDASQKSDLVQWLLDREALNSTGVGNGIAIPHPRTPTMDDTRPATILTAFLQQPIPYRAVDDRPVYVLFLLLSPTTQAHLHLLSRLSFCIRDTDFNTLLSDRPDPETLLAAVAAIECRLES